MLSHRADVHTGAAPARRTTQNVIRAELLEYSIVPIPANPRALILARSKGINVKPIAEWAEKALAGMFGAGCWTPKADLETAYFIGAGEKTISIPRLAVKDIDCAEVFGEAAAITDASGAELRRFAPLESTKAEPAETPDATPDNPAGGSGRGGAGHGGECG